MLCFLVQLWLYCCVFMPLRLKIGGHIVFVLSVILSFCPTLWNLNLANNFWTVSARALIFHTSIPCDKTSQWFHYFKINIRAFKLHMSISCDKIFLLVSRYLSLWPWPSLELAIIGGIWGICVWQTHLVSYSNGYLELSNSIDNVTGFPVWNFTTQLQNVGVSLLPVTLAVLWILVFLFTAFGARVSGWVRTSFSVFCVPVY